MPNINRWTSASSEMRRLTKRLNDAMARTARARSVGAAGGRVRGTSSRQAPAQPARRAAAAPRGGARVQAGVRVGPVGRQLLRVVNQYPRAGALTITSAFRPGARSHHRGLVYGSSPTAALDIWANSAAGMRDAAKWLYDRFAGDTVELIHTTPFNTDRGFYVKNQRKYPGGGVYGPQTRREHRDHVHFATSKALAAKILARFDAKSAVPPAPPARRPRVAAVAKAAPAARRRLSKRGAQLISEFEGMRERLYNDPAGHCTIGIGHLVHRGRCNGNEPAEFKRGITRGRAYQLLQTDSKRFENAVNGLGVPLNQNQFDALVSFTYNLGPGPIVEKTGIRAALKARRYKDVPREMKKWVKAGGKTLPGLVRRRNAEARLFVAPAAPRPQPKPPGVINVADVQPGDNNPSVLVVQQALRKAVGLDFSSGPGNFGPRTTKAYARWQRQCKVPANGRPELKSLKLLGDRYGFKVGGQAPPPRPAPRSAVSAETAH
jgi:GH24 family phage-related lysozyme (muramidase)